MVAISVIEKKVTVQVRPDYVRVNVASGGLRVAHAPAQGPKGATGATGASEPDVQRVAAQTLSGHRVVRLLPDRTVDYASASDVTHAEQVLGITVGAAISGADATVRVFGEISHSGWIWEEGKSVYCGEDGNLTQTAPTSGWVRRIGFASTSTRVWVDLGPTIYQ